MMRVQSLPALLKLALSRLTCHGSLDVDPSKLIAVMTNDEIAGSSNPDMISRSLRAI